MNLHNNKEAFIELILATSEYFGIDSSLIEKDYYVTLYLKYVNKKIDGLLFKGGTSLSKCYGLIDRFSEDIDLTLDNEHYSQSKKRKANKDIIEVCDELGLFLKNREKAENHSHSSYNAYFIEYPKLFPSNDIYSELKIEMVFIQKAYPYIEGKANSYIGKYLEIKGFEGIINRYELHSFPIKLQTLERTFVDKVFAICDYYLRGETKRNSRHIYDIHKIIPKIKLDDELVKLINEVREDRKKVKTCISSKDEYDINTLLSEIINKDFFKEDYILSTENLLTVPTKYEEAIESLRYVVDRGIFTNQK